MCNKIFEWLEQKGYHLMTIFMILQTMSFFTIIILYFVNKDNFNTLYHIYTFLSLGLFMVFMIHFAYHSINKAYFIELIAFLLMSTISSVLLVYYFFIAVILNESIAEDMKEICTIIGIICVILLIIGNIIYFISAYFAYNHFELIFMEKFGAKLIYHTIFSWMQFQHSMMKSDLGIITFLLLTTYIFDNSTISLLVIDGVYFIVSILIVVFMRVFIRSENKLATYLMMTARIVLEGYKLLRAYFLIQSKFNSKFTYGNVGVIGTVIFDEIILILIIISTIKCIFYYGKGFKEMVVKQKMIDIDNSNLKNDITRDF